MARIATRRNHRTSAVTWCLVCGLLLPAAGGDSSLSAQSAPSKEYQVKAVFLFNFAQFVEWPSASFAGDNAPLVIGVLGEDPFGAFLDETVRAEKVGNSPMQVQRYHRIDDVTTCHILFISRSEESRLEQILASLKDRTILVVGDSEDFIQRAGMIQLATSQGKIRLRINVNAATAANLTISSKLLRSAELVTGSK
jgi:YfiR/HmsC-like